MERLAASPVSFPNPPCVQEEELKSSLTPFLFLLSKIHSGQKFPRSFVLRGCVLYDAKKQ